MFRLIKRSLDCETTHDGRISIINYLKGFDLEILDVHERLSSKGEVLKRSPPRWDNVIE